MAGHDPIEFFSFIFHSFPFDRVCNTSSSRANASETARAVRIFFASLQSELAVNPVAKLRLLLFFDLSAGVMPCKCSWCVAISDEETAAERCA